MGPCAGEYRLVSDRKLCLEKFLTGLLGVIPKPGFIIEIPWPGTRCILCLEEKRLTLEHLIPEALGGKLTSRLLCKECNSSLGHRIEGKAKADPTIRLLAKGLRADIPALASNLEEGQKFASSVEPVGEFWLRKFAKYMI